MARIASQPDFRIGVIDAGMIDQERAIAEIGNTTALGDTLIEIERRTIARALKFARAQRLEKASNPETGSTQLSQW